MDAYYSKAKPKVVDYNPLTHMGFYNQPPSPQFSSSPMPRSSYNDKPFQYQKPISLAARNIFSNPRERTRLNALNNSSDSPRYYKTRPKDRIVDPISGEVRVFNIGRPRLENLDIGANKDRLTSEFDYQSVKSFHERKGKIKAMDNIAGSLKKEVPFVPYVDPFILKATSNAY